MIVTSAIIIVQHLVHSFYVSKAFRDEMKERQQIADSK